MTDNMFADVDNIEELIGNAIGAGSMCWEHVDRAGVFQSERASEILADTVERLSQIIGGLC